MPDDSRPRFRVLRPVSFPDGHFHWMQVGLAYQNTDGTIDAYVDMIPLGHHIRFRPIPPGEPDYSGQAGVPSSKEFS